MTGSGSAADTHDPDSNFLYRSIVHTSPRLGVVICIPDRRYVIPNWTLPRSQLMGVIGQLRSFSGLK